MHLYTIPRTPFFISFVALIYILFLFFFLRQDLMGLAVFYAFVPTAGCALIGLFGATLPVLFSEQAKSARHVTLNENGIEVTLVGRTTYISWHEVKSRFNVSGHIFMKLENGSHLMIPRPVVTSEIAGAIASGINIASGTNTASGTKKPA